MTKKIAKSFITLLSGGLDSAVATQATLHLGGEGLALFFDYGQRARRQEHKAAKALAKYWGLEIRVIALPFLAEVTRSALVMNDQVIPQIKLSKLDDRAEALKSAQQVWVPNRNGLFLNIAACIAEGQGLQKIVVGFNAEEAMTFPDNSANFLNRAQEFFQLSTLKGLELMAPTLGMHKTELVTYGLKLKVPFQKVWSCYLGARKQCGKCESCLRSLRAYHGAGILEQMAPYFEAASLRTFQNLISSIERPRKVS